MFNTKLEKEIVYLRNRISMLEQWRSDINRDLFNLRTDMPINFHVKLIPKLLDYLNLRIKQCECMGHGCSQILIEPKPEENKNEYKK